MMKMSTAYLDLVAWLTFAPPAWVTMVARVFVLTVSLFLLFEHLAVYKNSEEQKFLIGVILVVPCYAVDFTVNILPRKPLALSGNVGSDHAIFEQGASAGNVGKENIVKQKKANPVALLLSSAMMLRHLQFPSFSDRLETAVLQVILEGKVQTKDLGGDSTTQEVVHAVIANLD